MTKQEAGKAGGTASREKGAGMFSAPEELKAEWRARGLAKIQSKTPEELFDIRSRGGRAAQARPGGSGCVRKAG